MQLYSCGIIFKSSSMLPKLINKLDEILLRNQMVLRHKEHLIVSQTLKRGGELLCLVFLYQYQIASTDSPVATILTKLKLQFILPVSVKKCNHMENREITNKMLFIINRLRDQTINVLWTGWPSLFAFVEYNQKIAHSSHET